MHIPKLSLFLFYALIVFDFYNFEISKKKNEKYENRNFLEKYFENQKMFKNKTPSYF